VGLIILARPAPPPSLMCSPFMYIVAMRNKGLDGCYIIPVFGGLLDLASGAAPHAPVVVTNSAGTVTRYPLWGAVAEPSSNVYFECDVGRLE
jgi:hypothetical protein